MAAAWICETVRDPMSYDLTFATLMTRNLVEVANPEEERSMGVACRPEGEGLANGKRDSGREGEEAEILSSS